MKAPVWLKSAAPIVGYFWKISLLVLCIACIPYLLAFAVSFDQIRQPSGNVEFSAAPWLRWDSFHYLSIAKDGYTAQTCGEFICGNTGWFPLYPALIRLVAAAGTSYSYSAFFISVAALLASSEILSRLIQRRWSTVCVALAFVILPGGIYQVSAFPISVATAFGLGAIYALSRLDIAKSMFLGVCAALAYPSAVLFCLPLTPFSLQTLAKTSSLNRVFILLSTISPVIGLIAGQKLIDYAVGINNAYALTQARYMHSFGLGFEVLRSSVRYFWKSPIYFQTATVFLLLILSVVIVVRKASSGGAILSVAMVASGFSFWLIAHLLGDSVSIYRQEALIAPTFIFAGSLLGRKSILLLSIPLIALAAAMNRLFLDGTLV